MIKYLNSGEDYPILENKFALSFQGAGRFSMILNKMFPHCNIYLKYTYPDVGKIYFNSWRTREFICNRIVERDDLFMCFASYDGETLPPFAGNIDCIEFKDNKRVTPRSFDNRRFKK